MQVMGGTTSFKVSNSAAAASRSMATQKNIEVILITGKVSEFSIRAF
jgi:hypothetical protein